MGSRPKRFDVAGLHRDEVCEALGELARTVEEIGRQVGLERIMRVWGQNRPVRSAENFDADAQHFLASGVQFIDGCAKDLPPGLSKEQRQIRDRCDELAGSMEKVLVKRLEEQPAKTWSFVKVNVSPWVNKGEETLSMEKTAQTVKDLLRIHFDGSAWKAGMAHRAYWEWERKGPPNAKKPASTRQCRKARGHGIHSWIVSTRSGSAARRRASTGGMSISAKILIFRRS